VEIAVAHFGKRSVVDQFLYRVSGRIFAPLNIVIAREAANQNAIIACCSSFKSPILYEVLMIGDR